MSKALAAIDTLIAVKDRELVDYMLEHGDIISDYLNLYKEWKALQEQKRLLLQNEREMTKRS